MLVQRKAALFVHQPACSVDSVNGIIESLHTDYSFKLFSVDQVEDTFFDDVDLVCIPGGIGDADRFHRLMRYNKKSIKNFVQRGGKYLGICMGAYWAGKDYFDILQGIDAVQYIKRPHTDTRRPHPKALEVEWLGQQERMYFYDGCAFAGRNLKNATVVSSYKNKDPMAIIQQNIGLIGCHPESQRYWYNKKYLQPHWHQGKHYELLRDFVNKI